MELQIPNNSRYFLLQRARLLCHSAQFYSWHLRDLGVAHPRDSLKSFYPRTYRKTRVPGKPRILQASDGNMLVPRNSPPPGAVTTTDQPQRCSAPATHDPLERRSTSIRTFQFLSSLNLTPISEYSESYTPGPSANYATASPGRSYTPPNHTLLSTISTLAYTPSANYTTTSPVVPTPLLTTPCRLQHQRWRALLRWPRFWQAQPRQWHSPPFVGLQRSTRFRPPFPSTQPHRYSGVPLLVRQQRP